MMMLIKAFTLLILYATGAAAAPITAAEVATHKTTTDCWTIIRGNVYDITGFIQNGLHPNTDINADCGIDATKKYNSKHGTTNYISTKPNIVNKGPAAAAPGCFASETTVQLGNGARVAMHQLQVGDKIQVDQGQYEAVYGFAHRDANLKTDFLKIGWKVGKQNSYVEMTPGHMLLVSNTSNGNNKNWKMIPASMVKIGDEIMVAQEKERLIAKVRSIDQTQGNGAFAPLTFSGKVVANDVYASAYVSFQNREYLILGSGTPVKVSLQWLLHTYMLPFRWLGTLIAAPLGVDLLWWLPSFLSYLELGEHVFDLPAPLLLPVVVPAVTVMGLASAAEWFLLTMVWEHKLMAAMAVSTMVAIAALWKKSGCQVLQQPAHKKVV